ncbi:hypothetical protein [Cytobacillus purgationiresistens]|uniref:Uncharacterized protein n=1 Tax=Cytobacillus purgationiresistens TaxID=863449 RepID=A0ABU0AC89_9BACI|nr:hypothetical protein [Cytobacillus purgationiresistens]MDQ0268868.1 hypothetical protein [Cytobacillus purgationiresistens]
MTLRSGFFNSVNGDRIYKAESFAEYFSTFISNGVFPKPSTGLQVIANDDMSVSLRAGKGWIKGYYFFNDADYNLVVDVADGVLKRIDRIVLRLDFSNRMIVPLVKKGSLASSPVAPSLQRDADAYELGIADVLINNGTTRVWQANITDTRLNTSLCGIVHGLVNQVDTTTIFNQYLNWFEEIKTSNSADLEAFKAAEEQEFLEWFNSLQIILEGEVATNLANKIIALENEITTVQQTKITADTGAPKKIISSNLIEEIKSLGIGMHTFYSPPNVVQGVPSVGRSHSGIAVINDSSGNGYITAFDSMGIRYSNSILNGTPQGWFSDRVRLFVTNNTNIINLPPGLYYGQRASGAPANFGNDYYELDITEAPNGLRHYEITRNFDMKTFIGSRDSEEFRGWREVGLFIPGGESYLPLSLQNGTQSYGPTQLPGVARVGNLVYLRGSVTNINAVGRIIATLPSEFRPSQVTSIIQNTSQISNNARVARWGIQTDGTIRLDNVTDNNIAASHWLPIDGSFLV